MKAAGGLKKKNAGASLVDLGDGCGLCRGVGEVGFQRQAEEGDLVLADLLPQLGVVDAEAVLGGEAADAQLALVHVVVHLVGGLADVLEEHDPVGGVVTCEREQPDREERDDRGCGREDPVYRGDPPHAVAPQDDSGAVFVGGATTVVTYNSSGLTMWVVSVVSIVFVAATVPAHIRGRCKLTRNAAGVSSTRLATVAPLRRKKKGRS